MKRIAVIGGGASGVAAALRLKELNAALEVLLLEKNDRILKKLLSTGNGKCNITNTGVDAAMGENAFTRPVLAHCGFENVRAFLQRQGILIKQDAVGRCYPLSESANNAVNLLRTALDAAKVNILTGTAVTAIKKDAKGFMLCTAERQIFCDAVIFAAGSAAGVKGYNGLDLLYNLGLHFPRPKPALCPIPSNEACLKALKGVRVKGTLTLEGHSESGEIQFNDTSISGICAFNLAKYARDGAVLHINLNACRLPADQLLLQLKASAERADENARLLDFLVVGKLSLVLLKAADIQPSGNPRLLKETDFLHLISLIEDFSLTVNTPTDFSHAQTVCGGVGAALADASTLQSKAISGFFLCGEILDADAPCGGFNLHWAWASGMVAAQNTIHYLENSLD